MGRKLNDIINRLPAGRKAGIEALARQKTDEMLAYAKTLADFRKALGKTQTEVAAELGIKQHAVSQLEQRSDIYVSTLQRFVQSLGMRLEFSLTTPAGVRIALPDFHPWQRTAHSKGAANVKVLAGAATGDSRQSGSGLMLAPARAGAGAAASGKRRSVASPARKVPSRLTRKVASTRTQ